MKFYKTSHLLHLIMTLIFWPWILVWIYCACKNNQKNKEQQFYAGV